MFTNELILVRGIPGSGKTEFVTKYLKDACDRHIETDHFFTDDRGNYHFDGRSLPEAHRWCQDETEKMLKNNQTVVVSNTFSQQWEMQPYIDMAKNLDINLRVMTIHGDHGSVHNVPRDVIHKMISRWDHNPVL